MVSKRTCGYPHNAHNTQHTAHSTPTTEATTAAARGSWVWFFCAYLDVAAPAVQVEVQVLDLAVLAKGVVDGLLVGLLVHIGHDDDPALDGAHGRRLGLRLHVVDLGLGGGGRLGRAGLVDVHLYVGHGCARDWEG
jgi:hypothetical protein